jgi:hypothetical protein
MNDDKTHALAKIHTFKTFAGLTVVLLKNWDVCYNDTCGTVTDMLQYHTAFHLTVTTTTPHNKQPP